MSYNYIDASGVGLALSVHLILQQGPTPLYLNSVEESIIISKQRGFTLIELLVVIAIIALLMAILMPALARAKNQAGTIIYRSNLSKCGLAGRMYIEDNKAYFTRGGKKGAPDFRLGAELVQRSRH